MAPKTIPIMLGTGIVGDPSDPTAKINTPALIQEYVSVFRKHGHTTIDTSRRYSTNATGTSEALLGTTDIASWAILDTKVLSNPGDHSADNITKSISDSLAVLKIQQIHHQLLPLPRPHPAPRDSLLIHGQRHRRRQNAMLGYLELLHPRSPRYHSDLQSQQLPDPSRLPRSL